MTDEFKPKFPHALLTSGYKKWKSRFGSKIYVGAFYLHKQPVKFTSRLFKRAQEAQDYSSKVLARYIRLVNAKMLSMMVEGQA